MGQSIDKTMVTRAVISRILEGKKPSKIKAKHVLGHDTPKIISIDGKTKGYVPDIEAFYDKKTIVYEIELDKEMPIEKWKLFSLYARNNNGSLYLVVPSFLKKSIKEEIKENDISAGIISFQANINK